MDVFFRPVKLVPTFTVTASTAMLAALNPCAGKGYGYFDAIRTWPLYRPPAIPAQAKNGLKRGVCGVRFREAHICPCVQLIGVSVFGVGR